jgi:DHA1 family tetracycline resistance protein-like MFS transporter
MDSGPIPTSGRRALFAPRSAAFIFIFITVLLDMLALGMVMPVLPKLVEGFVDGNTARASEIFGVFGTAWALMQFLFSPVQGALSDRFGRRPLVLMSNFGLGLDYILMALAPSLVLLFVGRVISGITAASISTSYAYIADITPAAKRSATFGMLGAAFGLGFVVGPALGGVLGAVDPRLPFWTAAVLSLLNGCYGLLVLPESLSPERRATFTWRRANPIGSLALLRSQPHLLGLSGANLLAYVAHTALPTTFVLYAGYRYGWGEGMVGATLALVGACAVVVQAGLIRPIVGWLGDRRAMLVGFSSGALGFAVFGLAPTGALFWIGIPVMSMWGLASPTSQALMSRYVSPSEQGRLQGANSSIQGIGNLIGPSIFSLIFAYAIGAGRDWDVPGAAFLLAAVMLFGATLVAWRTTREH